MEHNQHNTTIFLMSIELNLSCIETAVFEFLHLDPTIHFRMFPPLSNLSEEVSVKADGGYHKYALFWLFLCISIRIFTDIYDHAFLKRESKKTHKPLAAHSLATLLKIWLVGASLRYILHYPLKDVTGGGMSYILSYPYKGTIRFIGLESGWPMVKAAFDLVCVAPIILLPFIRHAERQDQTRGEDQDEGQEESQDDEQLDFMALREMLWEILFYRAAMLYVRFLGPLVDVLPIRRPMVFL